MKRETKKSLGVKFLMGTFTLQDPCKCCDDTSPQEPVQMAPATSLGSYPVRKCTAFFYILSLKVFRYSRITTREIGKRNTRVLHVKVSG